MFNMNKIQFIEYANFLAPMLAHDSRARKEFDEYIKDCHPFIFSVKDIEVKDIREIEPTDERFDLPFPVISIEVMGKYISVPRPNEDQVWIVFFIVKEIAPKEYVFTIVVESINDNGQRERSVYDVKKGEGFENMNGILKHYLAKLSQEKIGVASRNQNIKIGSGKNKTFWRPKNITYVSPKKYIDNFSQLADSRNITWSHRWEVRGHWREIKGLGKDRDGKYGVVGHTWVMNHSKGPEHLPVIKKIRVVTEEA